MENIQSEMSKFPSKESIIKDILNGVLKCSSAGEIVQEILKNVPFEPSEEQHQAIKLSAEKLYALEEV